MRSFLILLLILFSQSLLAEGSGRRLTLDVGYSSGSSNGDSYSELNLGANYYLKTWLIWRNSGFSRNFSDESREDNYGLDSSIRLNVVAEIAENARLRLFGGPGWRFASEGESPPFAEGGLTITASGITIGGGAKVILNEVIDENMPNDTQYFITLSGSTSL